MPAAFDRLTVAELAEQPPRIPPVLPDLPAPDDYPFHGPATSDDSWRARAIAAEALVHRLQRALAQAVASCAATEQARDDAAAIVLLAKARIGELTAEVKATRPAEVARSGGHAKAASFRPGTQQTRTERLAAEGLSRKDAAECEKIAAPVLSGYFAYSCRLDDTADPHVGHPYVRDVLSRAQPTPRGRLLVVVVDDEDEHCGFAGFKAPAAN